MNDSYIAGELVAMHTLLAFLLARESVLSGSDVRLMHEPLVQEVSDAVAKFGGPDSLPPDQLVAAEASATLCLDHVFRLAEGMRALMPGKDGSWDS